MKVPLTVTPDWYGRRMAPGEPANVWLSTKETAERLGITLRTLYRFIDEGQMPAYKMGRVIRVKESDVEAFLDRARIRPGTLEHLYPEARSDASSGADSGS